jgi:hypothetical protein
VSHDESPDPDRAAILARRRRFIALAISGLATGGCRHQPQACLSISIPDEDGNGNSDAGAEGEDAGEPSTSGAFVEDPGAPVDGGSGETGEAIEPEPVPEPEPNPQPCLKVRPTPHPCLNVYKN